MTKILAEQILWRTGALHEGILIPTYAYLLQSIRTFRCMVIARAGRLTRINDRSVLRLAQNASVEQLYDRLEHALAA